MKGNQTRMNRLLFENWRPDVKAAVAEKKESVVSASGIPSRKRSSLQDAQRDSGSIELPGVASADGQSVDGVAPIGDLYVYLFVQILKL